MGIGFILDGDGLDIGEFGGRKGFGGTLEKRLSIHLPVGFLFFDFVCSFHFNLHAD